MNVYPLSLLVVLVATLLAEEISGRKGWAVIRFFLLFPSAILPLGPELSLSF